MAAQSRNIAELENASVWRLLVQYSLPSIAGMVVYSLYNIIDSVFIGHGVGPLALSGLAVTFPIMNLTFALGTLVGIGGAAISSIRLGKKDQEGTERTLGNVLIMSLIAAVVLVVPTLLFLTEILTAFGASGQTLTYAYDFMLVTLLGLPVTYVFFNLNHVMRATGYPKKAMGSTLLSVEINIILPPSSSSGSNGESPGPPWPPCWPRSPAWLACCSTFPTRPARSTSAAASGNCVRPSSPESCPSAWLRAW